MHLLDDPLHSCFVSKNWMDYTDESIYNDPHYRLYGTLTGYRLLVIGFSTLYTLYRLVLLVFGWHLIPVVPELAVVTALVIG